MAGKKDGAAGKPRKPSPASATKALLKAVDAGDLEGVKGALAAGANVHARYDNGIGAIHYACHEPGILRAMLAAGADPEARSEIGDPPFVFAVHPESIRLLIDAGADVNGRGFQGRTALHSAANDDEGHMLRALLEVGADVHARDEEGRTALHEAAEWSKSVTFLDLVRAGADLEARDDEGETPLETARFLGVSGARELMELRQELARMGKVDERTAELVGAADRGDLATVRTLIAAGVDLDAREYLPSHRLVTALYVASAAGHREIASALIEAGAGVDVRIESDASARPGQLQNATPLAGAARRGHVELIRLLGGAGADLEARSEPGFATPLMAAARDGRDDVLRALLELGADVNAATENEMFAFHGKTALAFAREAGQEAAVATLVERGGVELDLGARTANWKGEPTIFNYPR